MTDNPTSRLLRQSLDKCNDGHSSDDVISVPLNKKLNPLELGDSTRDCVPIVFMVLLMCKHDKKNK